MHLALSHTAFLCLHWTIVWVALRTESKMLAFQCMLGLGLQDWLRFGRMWYRQPADRGTLSQLGHVTARVREPPREAFLLSPPWHPTFIKNMSFHLQYIMKSVVVRYWELGVQVCVCVQRWSCMCTKIIQLLRNFLNSLTIIIQIYQYLKFQEMLIPVS